MWPSFVSVCAFVDTTCKKKHGGDNMRISPPPFPLRLGGSNKGEKAEP